HLYLHFFPTRRSSDLFIDCLQLIIIDISSRYLFTEKFSVFEIKSMTDSISPSGSSFNIHDGYSVTVYCFTPVFSILNPSAFKSLSFSSIRMTSSYENSK